MNGLSNNTLPATITSQYLFLFCRFAVEVLVRTVLLSCFLFRPLSSGTTTTTVHYRFTVFRVIWVVSSVREPLPSVRNVYTFFYKIQLFVYPF